MLEFRHHPPQMKIILTPHRLVRGFGFKKLFFFILSSSACFKNKKVIHSFVKKVLCLILICEIIKLEAIKVWSFYCKLEIIINLIFQQHGSKKESEEGKESKKGKEASIVFSPIFL
jgi:hypothetical protein